MSDFRRVTRYGDGLWHLGSECVANSDGTVSVDKQGATNGTRLIPDVSPYTGNRSYYYPSTAGEKWKLRATVTADASMTVDLQVRAALCYATGEEKGSYSRSAYGTKYFIAPGETATREWVLECEPQDGEEWVNACLHVGNDADGGVAVVQALDLLRDNRPLDVEPFNLGDVVCSWREWTGGAGIGTFSALSPWRDWNYTSTNLNDVRLLSRDFYYPKTGDLFEMSAYVDADNAADADFRLIYYAGTSYSRTASATVHRKAGDGHRLGATVRVNYQGKEDRVRFAMYPTGTKGSGRVGYLTVRSAQNYLSQMFPASWTVSGGTKNTVANVVSWPAASSASVSRNCYNAYGLHSGFGATGVEGDYRVTVRLRASGPGKVNIGAYYYKMPSVTYSRTAVQAVPVAGGCVEEVSCVVPIRYKVNEHASRIGVFFNTATFYDKSVDVYDIKVERLDMAPQYVPGDVQLRATAYSVLGERVGPLPHVEKLTVTQPRNDLATLSLTYAAEGVNADLFSERDGLEVGVEYSYDGRRWFELPGGRFLQQKVSSNPTKIADTVSFGGVNLGAVLSEAILWEVPQESQDSDGKWNFLSRNAGTILRTVWDAATARGWGEGLTLDCTASADAAGEAWATITTLAFDKTVTLKSVLDSLADIGMIDWQWEGRTLRVFNADSALTEDKSATMRWPLATGVTGAPESSDWSQLCTDVLVKGEAGAVWHFHNEDAPSGLRRIEKVVEAGGVEQEATARMVAETTLQQGANVSEEVKREWHAADMRYMPWVDYSPGQWVGVQRGERFDKLQVAQLSVTLDKDGVSGHTTFGTVLDDLLSRLAKKQKGIVGAASIAGNTTRPADTSPKRTPAAPSGLVGRTTPYTIATGAERAVLELTWAPVAADTRGNAMDQIEYEVLLQVDGTERLWPMGSGASGTIEGLYVGDTYQVYVRAKSTEFGTLSSWSEGITITPEGDSGIPPVPYKPTCSSNLAVLTVKWGGVDVNGDAMPSDFDHLEVSVTAPEASPVVVARTYAPEDREINVPGLSAGRYYVRLRAWDSSGNVSDWSEYTSVTVAALVDSGALREELELMLPEITDASAIYQRAAALVAGGDVKWGPYPPDEGVPGTTFWIAPDGKLWIMKSKAAAARSDA